MLVFARVLTAASGHSIPGCCERNVLYLKLKTILAVFNVVKGDNVPISVELILITIGCFVSVLHLLFQRF